MDIRKAIKGNQLENTDFFHNNELPTKYVPLMQFVGFFDANRR